ncbi:MAG: toll/interleukin-1 receptor domain-containing protein [Lewinellaceae bacterium]|nr:toll/interleukin-1 receptor domain-containing protein [Lewinellaceae bacterium]
MMDSNKKIFIAYSNEEEDRRIAFKVCDALENKGMACWIAPRDIPPATVYGREISKAIKNAAAVVLILSEHADEAHYVLTEINMAFGHNIKVFPLRIKNIATFDNLEYYISIIHWIDAFDEPRDDRINELVEYLQAEFRQPLLHPTATPDKTDVPPQYQITQLIKVLFYPFSLALQEIQEQELNERNIGTLGLYNAVFKLNELFAKFSVFCLLAAYREYTAEEYDANIDKKVVDKLRKTNVDWVDLLEFLVQFFEGKEGIPSFLQGFLQYISQPFEQYNSRENIDEAIRVISLEKNGQFVKGRTILSFLKLLVQYESQFKNRGKQIEGSAISIKNAFLAIFHESDFFNRQKMLWVRSIHPDNAKKAFDIKGMDMKGGNPDREDCTYYTNNWGIVSDQIIFFEANKEHIEAYLNLHPFIIPAREDSELLIWDQTKGFIQISYKSVGGKSNKEFNADETDDLLKRFKAAHKGLRLDEEGGITIEMVRQILEETTAHIKIEVTNPISSIEYLSSLQNYQAQLDNYLLEQQGLSLRQLHARINQIRNDADQGGFNHLKKTDHSEILTDRYGGKYIIAAEFFRKNRGNIKEQFILDIIQKDATEEVKLLLYLSFLESSGLRQKQAVIGVEHLMIALSKVCNKFVFDWYDAIEIPQKLHRDIIRRLIKKRQDKGPQEGIEGQLIVKPRLKKVLQMAVEESNRAKQEEVSLRDCFSAVLREGDSLPVRVLLDVFDMTHDSLLGEYYKLLLKSR